MGLHTRTARGTRVEVILKDGTVLRDTFVERPKCKRWIVLKKYGRVAMRDIKAFTDVKGRK